MLEQMQSLSNHTSKTKVYFNEFVANVLRDKTKLASEKKGHFLVLNIKNLGSR